MHPRKRNQLKAIFAVYAKDRKQTKNLNVYSPPPESTFSTTDKIEAQRVLNEKKKLYKKVKLVKKFI